MKTQIEHDLIAALSVESELADDVRILFEKHSQMIHSVAMRVLKNRAAAEDVMQDIFMDVCRRPERFPIGSAGMPAYLAVATRNRCIDRLRSTKPYEPLDNHPLIASKPFRIEEEIDLQATRKRIWDAICRLPPTQREALNLAYVEGLPHRAIADMLDAPLGTIKTRIKWGLQTVRRSL